MLIETMEVSAVQLSEDGGEVRASQLPQVLHRKQQKTADDNGPFLK